jgi:hypothetical protein
MSGDQTMGGFYSPRPAGAEEDAAHEAMMGVAFPQAADRQLTHEERLARLAGPLPDDDDALFAAHMRRFPGQRP